MQLTSPVAALTVAMPVISIPLLPALALTARRLPGLPVGALRTPFGELAGGRGGELFGGPAALRG